MKFPGSKIAVMRSWPRPRSASGLVLGLALVLLAVVRDVRASENGSALPLSELFEQRIKAVVAVEFFVETETERRPSTVVGLVYSVLGRVPRPGDELTIDGHRVVVERVDRRRVTQVSFEKR